MNCREAELQIYADKAGVSDADRHDALAAHLATCVACRRKHDSLGLAFRTWRTNALTTPVPDADRAWSDLRREIRAGAVAARLPSPILAWIATPLVAAAALALMMVSEPRSSGPGGAPPSRQVARAEFVEVPSLTASTVVYVDDKSGWLVVWASETNGLRI